MKLEVCFKLVLGCTQCSMLNYKLTHNYDSVNGIYMILYESTLYQNYIVKI